MQPTTPYSPYETDPNPRHELFSVNPEVERNPVERARGDIDGVYEQRREQQQGVARAAIDQQGLHTKSPETVNPTPAEWVAMVGDAIEKIRSYRIDHTMMYGETTITTSPAENAVSQNYPLQDISRVTNQDELDLAA